MLLTTVNNENLQQGIQRIDTLFKDETEFPQIRLELEIVPLKKDEMEHD
jgi:hypothetical protein